MPTPSRALLDFVALLAAAAVAGAASAELTSLDALQNSCKTACSVGFLSTGNAETVHHLFPVASTKVIIVSHVADLIKMVQNGTLTAGLISGVPIDPNSTLYTFSSGQISPRGMAMTDAVDTRDLSAALDAAIVRLQLAGTDYQLAAANPPFRFVAVKTCKASASSALAYFPFPNQTVATGKLKTALARGYLNIASLGPYNWGGNDGDYTASPPQGFWPDYYNKLEQQLQGAYGANFSLKRVWKLSSAATMQLLLDDQADATEPYWTVDSFFGGRARKANFRFSCTSLGVDSTFFTAKPTLSTPTGTAGVKEVVVKETTDFAVAIGVAIAVVGVGALACVLMLVSKERAGSPLFAPLSGKGQGVQDAAM